MDENELALLRWEVGRVCWEAHTVLHLIPDYIKEVCRSAILLAGRVAYGEDLSREELLITFHRIADAGWALQSDSSMTDAESCSVDAGYSAIMACATSVRAAAYAVPGGISSPSGESRRPDWSVEEGAKAREFVRAATASANRALVAS